jgi:hypothetical protein
MRLRLTREENFDGLGSSRLEPHPGQLLTPWADREYATGHSFRRNVRCAEGKPIKSDCQTMRWRSPYAVRRERVAKTHV